MSILYRNSYLNNEIVNRITIPYLEWEICLQIRVILFYYLSIINSDLV